MLKILIAGAAALAFLLQGDCTDPGRESSAYYDDWDANSDSYLSDQEVADGLYGEWDSDGDEILSQSEFDSFGVDEHGGFADVDADRNSSISRQEFDERYRTSGVFSRWDTNADGRLDRDEYDAVREQYDLQ